MLHCWGRTAWLTRGAACPVRRAPRSCAQHACICRAGYTTARCILCHTPRPDPTGRTLGERLHSCGAILLALLSHIVCARHRAPSCAAHTFGEWLHGRFKELGLDFPTVTVAYRDLK